MGVLIISSDRWMLRSRHHRLLSTIPPTGNFTKGQYVSTDDNFDSVHFGTDI